MLFRSLFPLPHVPLLLFVLLPKHHHLPHEFLRLSLDFLADLDRSYERPFALDRTQDGDTLVLTLSRLVARDLGLVDLGYSFSYMFVRYR